MIWFERHLEKNLLDLAVDLENRTYRHGSYQAFEIRDSKRRRIDKATARDRVVHELVFRYLERVFEPRFIADSFSNRQEEGTLEALRKLDEFLTPWRSGGSDWFVVIGDGNAFFGTISHKILLSCLSNLVTDRRVFELV